MSFWKSIKKDMKKNLNEGIHILTKGTSSFMGWAEELTEEGKKKIKAFEIKQKIQVQFTELGGKLYDLREKNVKSPFVHASVKPILKKIDSLKKQLEKAEGGAQPSPKKTAKKKKGTKKKSKKKTVKKSTSAN